VHVTTRITPKGVSPDGDLSYAFQLVDARVDATPGAAREESQALEKELAVVKGLTGTGVVSSRGVTKDLAFALPKGASQVQGQMLEQVRQMLRDLATPLPEEDVGKNAKWDRTTKIDSQMTKVTQKETFVLVELDGDKGKVTTTVSQSAPPQAISPPGMPPSAHARMESLVATGAGSSHFDLARLVPSSEFNGTTTMVIAGDSPSGQTQRMKMIMHLGVTTEGKAL
jgi:hypothetical protein